MKSNKVKPTRYSNEREYILNDPILFDNRGNASEKKTNFVFDKDLNKNGVQQKLLPIVQQKNNVQKNFVFNLKRKEESPQDQLLNSNSRSNQEEEKNTSKYIKRRNSEKEINKKIKSNDDDRSSSFQQSSQQISQDQDEYLLHSNGDLYNGNHPDTNEQSQTISNQQNSIEEEQFDQHTNDQKNDDEEDYQVNMYDEDDYIRVSMGPDYSEEDGEMSGYDQQQQKQSNNQSDENSNQEEEEQDQDDDQDNNNDEDDENYEDDDQDIEERVQKTKPVLSDAAMRILNFQLRRINPSIPRGAVQKTLRDQSGKRVVLQQEEQIFQIQKKEPLFQFQKKEENNDKKRILQNNEGQKRLQNNDEELSFKRNDEEQKLQNNEGESRLDILKKNLIQKKREYEQKQQQQAKLQYNSETKWKYFLFTDEMCTPQNIENAKRLKLFDYIFEVDSNYQLDTNLIVKPYERSNQGKQETVWRSDVGMVKSLQRLHEIFCDREKRKDDGKIVSIVDIFQYISDRFRALSTELRQIESQNRFNTWNSQVKQFSCQIVRIYLLSYLEMMQADQVTDEIMQNKKNCQQYLIFALDDLILDYSMLFYELTEDRYYLLDNLPEFIQYYHLMLTLSILSMESIQKLSKLDYIIYKEFPFSEQLMNTKEYRFCKNVQDYMIIKNYKALLDLANNPEITIFQLFFVYLFQERIKDQINSEKFKEKKIFFDEQKGLSLEYIDIAFVSQKVSSIQKIPEVINFRKNFSQIILGKIPAQIIQPTNQTPIQVIKQNKTQKNFKNILVEIGRKLVVKQITNFVTPHFEKVEEQLGKFYRMLRIMKHWKLFTMQSKRMKIIDKLGEQKQRKDVKQPKLSEPSNFRIDLCKKLTSQFPNQSHFYYKIVILNNNQNNTLLSKLLFTLSDNTFSQQDDSILVEMKFNTQQREIKLLLSIQILDTLQIERICGTDIYIFLRNQNYPGKPCLFIDTQNTNENTNFINLNYEYIELFDNYYDSFEFKEKIFQVVDLSLKNKKPIPELQLLSLGDLFIKIKQLNVDNYNPKTVEYFIQKCATAEMFLEKILENNYHSEDLPQELLFDRYINQDLVLRYAAKFNPGNKLMIPLFSKLQREYINEGDLVNEIKCYLEDYVDEEALLNLLRKDFKFGKTCSGNWQVLIEFIFEQLVQYLEDSQIYFIVNRGKKIVIDEKTIQKRIQKDIQELLKPKQNQKSQIMSKIFKPQLEELFKKKKVCK